LLRKKTPHDTESVLIRQVDAIMHYKGADQLLAVKALNEFDPKCAVNSATHAISVLAYEYTMCA